MSAPKPIFFDPERKRWRRLRLLLDISVIVITLLVAFFVITIFRGSSVPGSPARGQEALSPAERHQKRKPPKPSTPIATPKSRPPSGAELWKASAARSTCSGTPPASPRCGTISRRSTCSFPSGCTSLTADGRLQSVTETNTLFDVMDDKGKPRPVDDKVMPFLKSEKAQTEVLPLVNNFDPVSNQWQPDVTAKFLADPAARQRFRHELMTFLATDQYKGMTLDIEAFPDLARRLQHAGAGAVRRPAQPGTEALYRRAGERPRFRLRRRRAHLRRTHPDEL